MKIIVLIFFISLKASAEKKFSQFDTIESKLTSKVNLLEKACSLKKAKYVIELNAIILTGSGWEKNEIYERLEQLGNIFSQANITISARVYELTIALKHLDQGPFLNSNMENIIPNIQKRSELIEIVNELVGTGSLNIIYLRHNSNLGLGGSEGTPYAAWNASEEEGELRNFAWIPITYVIEDRDRTSFVDAHELAHILFRSGHDHSENGGYILSINNASNKFSEENKKALLRSEFVKPL